MFASVLTESSTPVSIATLHELALVTGVISLCQIGEEEEEEEEGLIQHGFLPSLQVMICH